MFKIFHQENLVGTSALDDGDPPMGCAHGVFIAQQGFWDFRANVAQQPDDDPEMRRWVGFSVRTADGVEVECLEAVLFECNFGDHNELRIDVLGIPYPRYEELFPNRYAAYESAFDKK